MTSSKTDKWWYFIIEFNTNVTFNKIIAWFHNEKKYLPANFRVDYYDGIWKKAFGTVNNNGRYFMISDQYLPNTFNSMKLALPIEVYFKRVTSNKVRLAIDLKSITYSLYLYSFEVYNEDFNQIVQKTTAEANFYFQESQCSDRHKIF